MKNTSVSVKSFVVILLLASSPQLSANAWQALIEGTDNGLNPQVYALALDGGMLYAGGTFTTSGSGAKTLRRIAKWNGSVWTEVGFGVT
jgi:hypothetical protein